MGFAYSFNGNSRAVLHNLNQKAGSDDPVLGAAGQVITEIINTFADGTFLLVEVNGERASGAGSAASPDPATLSIKVTPIVLSAGTVLVSKSDDEMKAAQAKADADTKAADAKRDAVRQAQTAANADSYGNGMERNLSDADLAARVARNGWAGQGDAVAEINRRRSEHQTDAGRPTNWGNDVERHLTDDDLAARAGGAPWVGQAAAVAEITRRRDGGAIVQS